MTSEPTERLFRLPDLGEGLTEAEIIEWKVAVGDTVEIDQIVVEVETAKATVEVPVPYAGTVLKLHTDAGTSVEVGRPLISVGTPQTAPVPPAGPVAEGPAAARYREEERAGSGNVLIGYGTGHAPASRRRRRTGAKRAPASTHRTAAPAPPASGSAEPASRARTAPRVISPLVRRLAREHGVDLAALSPSGPHGIIQRRDVERVIAAAGTVSAPAAPVRPETGSAERIPLRGLRRAVAEKLSRSRTEIPDATTWVDVDATGLLEAKNAFQAARPDARIGLLAVLARICVAGLRRFPELNSTVDTDRNEIVRYSHVNLGFAAQTERGLVVPVVRDAHRMTTTQIAAELARLTALARSGQLPPEALTGGTFTLNNYGVFGVDGSTPVINHPEAGILGVGRIIDKPWAADGALVLRKVTQLSLSFDHRVCDGGVAGGFLRYIADCIERPATLLADV
ncbi:dihydrolipoamide acetyltransferase family protein [Streptomyces jeddahensis]|uniref:Dihydrolipoamide acetyltransferase component of pyruvate dehydrogenase complex n=1 Tax=Streptomyces jeddahensis TaxID=1716141 RepID=A0A177HNH3_9ACTN|nr:dihydrolipoamide acetyltransferase family protein [Streptomyces jeddahensis]OAH11758.1 dihydrolipoyllysine-residue acetyltransferase component of pyruvate dehydrogenase complex [Streptomyces jeddahensis]